MDFRCGGNESEWVWITWGIATSSRWRSNQIKSNLILLNHGDGGSMPGGQHEDQYQWWFHAMAQIESTEYTLRKYSTGWPTSVEDMSIRCGTYLYWPTASPSYLWKAVLWLMEEGELLPFFSVLGRSKLLRPAEDRRRFCCLWMCREKEWKGKKRWGEEIRKDWVGLERKGR